MLYLFIYYCLRGEIKMQRKGGYDIMYDSAIKNGVYKCCIYLFIIVYEEK
jgi:hypothetical protein